jgi:hypothetical protein
MPSTDHASSRSLSQLAISVIDACEEPEYLLQQLSAEKLPQSLPTTDTNGLGSSPSSSSTTANITK